MRRLRAWKLRKREHINAKFMAKLGDSKVDLDDASIKILILKLKEIELLLKEVGKQKKRSTKSTRRRKHSKKVRAGLRNQISSVIEEEE